MTYQKQSGKTNQPSKSGGATNLDEVGGFVPSPALVVGSICHTDYFNNTVMKVACTSVTDSMGVQKSQSGVLVTVQRWDGEKMYGKMVQLDIAWLRTTGDYWYEASCPFDDDIPF